MKLIDAIKEMSTLKNPGVDTICAALEDGYHVLVGDQNNYGYDMMKYDICIDDGVLFLGKMSDSTSDKIVITLEMAALYEKGVMNLLWDSYLSGKDVFIVDNVGHMNDAQVNSGQFTVATIKKQLKPGEIISFNDIYSTPQVADHPATKVYVEDNKEAPICGLEAVKIAAQTVVNTTIIPNKKAADFIILVMKNATKAPTKKMYEWLDESNKDIPLVAETLKDKKLAYSEPHKILLYWSSTVVMAGLFDPNSAMYKAAMELDEAITSYHKG